VKMVTESFTNLAHAGRFGWKDDHATLRGFPGDCLTERNGHHKP
jgi:hypothetical protein